MKGVERFLEPTEANLSKKIRKKANFEVYLKQIRSKLETILKKICKCPKENVNSLLQWILVNFRNLKTIEIKTELLWITTIFPQLTKFNLWNYSKLFLKGMVFNHMYKEKVAVWTYETTLLQRIFSRNYLIFWKIITFLFKRGCL